MQNYFAKRFAAAGSERRRSSASRIAWLDGFDRKFAFTRFEKPAFILDQGEHRIFCVAQLAVTHVDKAGLFQQGF